MSKRRSFNQLAEKVRERSGAAERIAGYRRELEDAMTLADLRRARHFTQMQLAETLESTQPAISQMERRTDLYLSTLRSYVEALGGQLELRAVFEDIEIPIRSISNIGEEAHVAETTRNSELQRALAEWLPHAEGEQALVVEQFLAGRSIASAARELLLSPTHVWLELYQAIQKMVETHADPDREKWFALVEEWRALLEDETVESSPEESVESVESVTP